MSIVNICPQEITVACTLFLIEPKVSNEICSFGQII